LPPDQGEIEAYMSFAPDENYHYSYTKDPEVGYFQATSSIYYIHSYTITVTNDLNSNITCKKIGTEAPGPADYIEGSLSCQLGTTEA
jgi:hypothetical protein